MAVKKGLTSFPGTGLISVLVDYIFSVLTYYGVVDLTYSAYLMSVGWIYFYGSSGFTIGFSTSYYGNFYSSTLLVVISGFYLAGLSFYGLVT